MPIVLFFDHDPTLRGTGCAALSAAGHRVVPVASHAIAADHLRRSRWDLVLLDLDRDPDQVWAWVTMLYQRRQRPTIIVTATHARDSRAIAAGLDRGADAYLVKPIAPEVLVAQVAMLLRRQLALPIAAAPPAPALSGAASAIQLPAITIDPASRQVWIRDRARPLALNRGEFDLLLALARDADAIVPLQTHYGHSPQTLYAYVSRLRRKLAPYLTIENCPGAGYRLSTTPRSTRRR